MIIICGPGAVGLRLAADLSLRGEEVALMGRSGPMTGSFDYFVEEQCSGLEFPNHLSARTDLLISAIFVCVKAYDVEQALCKLDLRGFAEIPTFVLSNGYYERDIERYLNRDSLILGATNIAAKVEGTSIRRTDTAGKVFIPETELKISENIVKLLENYPDLFQKIDAQIRKKKWIVNCSLNTLCAALKLERNGDALQHLEELQILFSESFALADDLFPEKPVNKEKTYDWMLETINSTLNNQNSMFSDVKARRPTEIEYLSGLADEKYPKLYEYTRRIQSFYN